MKRGLSTYCDLLRFTAALTVFVSHVSWHALSGGFLYQLEHYGHPAVVVFFVLSGYVIGTVAHEKERTLPDYAAARLARLYSVVIPAILLTFVLDRIGMAIRPDLYALDGESMPLARMGLASLFLTQSWYLNLDLFSNDAWWSLPFEFWYYVLFGAAFYLRGRRRGLALGAAALIAGPNILLMFPLWLFGLAAYRLSKTAAPGQWTRAGFVVTGVLALGLFAWRGTPFPLPLPADRLPPEFHITDYSLGLLIAANLFFAAHSDLGFGRLAKPIAGAAAMTFSLYLFHLPMLYLVAAIEPASWPAALRGLVMLAAVPPVVYALSRLTEARKGQLRALISRLLAGPRPARAESA